MAIEANAKVATGVVVAGGGGDDDDGALDSSGETATGSDRDCGNGTCELLTGGSSPGCFCPVNAEKIPENGLLDLGLG